MVSPSFSYESLFAQNVPVTGRAPNVKAKYDFAVAYPAPETMPLDGLVEAVREAMDREGRDLSYYPHPAGLPALRELLADKLGRDRNMTVSADDIVLTAGSGEAIGMMIQAMTDPGDVLLTEEFVYLGTLRQMRRYRAEVVGVKCDEQGIIPDVLADTIKRLQGQGKKVKFLYTIPTFQNPLGFTMTLERRQRVLEICQGAGLPIFEDDCYVDLRFEGEDVTSFHSMDDSGSVVYTGSFSKIVAPGMRMGYLVAPNQVMERAMSFKSPSGANEFAASDHRAVPQEGNVPAHRRPERLAAGQAGRHAGIVGREFRRRRHLEPSRRGPVHLADDAGRGRPCRTAGTVVQRGRGVLQWYPVLARWKRRQYGPAVLRPPVGGHGVRWHSGVGPHFGAARGDGEVMETATANQGAKH